MNNVIRISLDEDLTKNVTQEMGILLTRLQQNMKMCDWKMRNRNARPTEDPKTWDLSALESLEAEIEGIL